MGRCARNRETRCCRVVQPDVVTHDYLIDHRNGDKSPVTRPLSRDVHATAKEGATRMWFYTSRDILHASESAERRRTRGSDLVLGAPAPALYDVPAALRRQAIELGNNAWRAFPSQEQTAAVVRYLPQSKQLEVVVWCEPDARVSLEELHAFVGATSATFAWLESDNTQSEVALLVGARIAEDPVVTEHVKRSASGDRESKRRR